MDREFHIVISEEWVGLYYYDYTNRIALPVTDRVRLEAKLAGHSWSAEYDAEKEQRTEI